MEDDPLLTLTEAAGQLGVTKKTIYRWVKSGVLDVISLPSGKRPTYRIRESMIETMIMVADRTGQDIANKKPAYDWLSSIKRFRIAL